MSLNRNEWKKRREMTNLEILRQELMEFVDEATDRDLFNIASSLGYDICDRCVTTSCDRDCFKGFAFWGQQEHKELEGVYVRGGDYEDKLIKLLEGLQVHESATVESLLRAGFTNYSKPILHKSWRIELKDKYPVYFIVDIAKSSLEITEFTVRDECFGRPRPCGKEEYRQIEQIIDELVNKKILERCKE